VVVSRQVTGDLAGPQVDPHVAAARAVRADGVTGAKVEGTRHEPIGGSGEGPDWADLDDIAGERRSEILARRDAHLLRGAPVEQLDEAIPTDLVAEPGAPRAEHAPLPVQLHQRRERDRLAVGPLG